MTLSRCHHTVIGLSSSSCQESLLNSVLPGYIAEEMLRDILNSNGQRQQPMNLQFHKIYIKKHDEVRLVTWLFYYIRLVSGHLYLILISNTKPQELLYQPLRCHRALHFKSRVFIAISLSSFNPKLVLQKAYQPI